MVGKAPLNGGEIPLTLLEDEANDRIVERDHDLWSIPASQPTRIFVQADITPIVHSSQLTAAIPAGDLATAGTATETVFNPAPGGGTSNAYTLTITSSDDNRLRNADFDDDSSLNGKIFVDDCLLR